MASNTPGGPLDLLDPLGEVGIVIAGKVGDEQLELGLVHALDDDGGLADERQI